jgi:hypothetical protein
MPPPNNMLAHAQHEVAMNSIVTIGNKYKNYPQKSKTYYEKFKTGHKF